MEWLLCTRGVVDAFQDNDAEPTVLNTRPVAPAWTAKPPLGFQLLQPHQSLFPPTNALGTALNLPRFVEHPQLISAHQQQLQCVCLWQTTRWAAQGSCTTQETLRFRTSLATNNEPSNSPALDTAAAGKRLWEPKQQQLGAATATRLHQPGPEAAGAAATAAAWHPASSSRSSRGLRTAQQLPSSASKQWPQWGCRHQPLALWQHPALPRLHLPGGLAGRQQGGRPGRQLGRQGAQPLPAGAHRTPAQAAGVLHAAPSQHHRRHEVLGGAHPAAACTGTLHNCSP